MSVVCAAPDFVLPRGSIQSRWVKTKRFSASLKQTQYFPEVADVPYDLSNSAEGPPSQLTELSCPSGEIQGERLSKCWQLNYHEAAIFLEEGENNDKLDYHPCSRQALPAYLVVHNRLFYCLDLLAASVLMGLAFMEAPAVPGMDVPLPVSNLEPLLVCLEPACSG